MDYLDAVQHFIEGARRATDRYELGVLFENSIRDLGCEYFACVSSVNFLDPPIGAVALGDYPIEWISRFYEQGYYEIDPVLRTAEKRHTPFFWSDRHWRATLTSDQLNILDEATESGLRNGVSIPIHCTDGYPASCSVTFGSDGIDPKAVHALHLMSIYLHEAALRMRERPAAPPDEHLSPRQNQCLELVAQGKSDWEISCILGLSESTIHKYVHSAMVRLNVATRAQAVVKALFRGQIKFADLSVERTDSTIRIRFTEEQSERTYNPRSVSM